MTIVTTTSSMNGSASTMPHQPPSAAGGKPGGGVDPLRVIRKHKIVLVIAGFIGGVLGVAGHFALAEFRPTWSTPVVYKCFPPQTEVNPDNPNIDDEEFERFMATEASIMGSELVLRRAVENPRLINEAPDWINQFESRGVYDYAAAAIDLEDRVNARPSAGTDLIRMRVSWTDAAEVAALASVVKDTYLQDLRRRGARTTTERRETLQRAINNLEDEQADIEAQRDEIVTTKRLDQLNVSLSQEQQAMQLVQTSIQEVTLNLQAVLSQKAEMEAQLRNPQGLQFNDQLRAQVEMHPVVAGLRQQIILTEIERDAMKEDFGEDHLTIQRMDDRIGSLQRNLDQQRESLRMELFQANLSQLRIAENQFRAQLAQQAEKQDALTQRLNELVLAQDELANLANELMSLAELRAEFEKDLRMVEATSQLSTASRVEVIQSERIPTVMAFPKIYIMGPAGVVLVVALVGGVVFLLELIDQRVKSPADISALPSVRVLGMIPHASEDPVRIVQPERVFAEQPTTSTAESFRQVRSSIIKRMRMDGSKSLAVVSAMPGSGSTTIASNLAEALAAADNRVLLIDANLRRPRLHEVFGLPVGPGVGEMLGGTPLAEVVQKPGGPNLRIITAGEIDASQMEAMATGTLQRLLLEATQHADYVILDVAPAAVSGDAYALAQIVDCTMLVARAFGETRGQIGRLSRELSEQPAEYLGVLVNAARGASGGYLRGNIRASHSYAVKAAG
ncbi:MAG: hypothetical protein AAFX79_09225 [Planctomycetota bacterium]